MFQISDNHRKQPRSLSRTRMKYGPTSIICLGIHVQSDTQNAMKPVLISECPKKMCEVSDNDDPVRSTRLMSAAEQR